MTTTERHEIDFDHHSPEFRLPVPPRSSPTSTQVGGRWAGRRVRRVLGDLRLRRALRRGAGRRAVQLRGQCHRLPEGRAGVAYVDPLIPIDIDGPQSARLPPVVFNWFTPGRARRIARGHRPADQPPSSSTLHRTGSSGPRATSSSPHSAARHARDARLGSRPVARVDRVGPLDWCTTPPTTRSAADAIRTSSATSAARSTARRADLGDDLFSDIMRRRGRTASCSPTTRCRATAVLVLLGGMDTTVRRDRQRDRRARSPGPELRQQLIDDPALHGEAIEEFLRYDRPVAGSTAPSPATAPFPR